MFCGIIQAIGTIESIDFVDRCDSGSGSNSGTQVGAALLVAGADNGWSVPLGGSVAHNGICLTLTRPLLDGRCYTFVGAETLRVTAASHWRVGTRLNLEPAMRAGDPIGGHFVSGHVDDVIQVLSVDDDPDGREVWLSLPRQWLPYVAPKGSIAVDGISLTINEVIRDRFRVNLIPHTLVQTQAGDWQTGDNVHLENDPFARQIVHALRYLQEGGMIRGTE